MKKKLDKRFFIPYLAFEVIDNVKRFTARPTAAAAHHAHHARRRIGHPPGKRFGGRAKGGRGLGVCVETLAKAYSPLPALLKSRPPRPKHTPPDQRF